MMYFVEKMGYNFMSAGALVIVKLIYSRFPGHAFDFPYLRSCIFLDLKCLSHFLYRFLDPIPMGEKGILPPRQEILQIPAEFPRIQLNSDSLHPEITSDPTG